MKDISLAQETVLNREKISKKENEENIRKSEWININSLHFFATHFVYIF